MISFFRFLFLSMLVVFITTTSYSQTFDAPWWCDYATIDDQPNSTGYPTIKAGVIKPNTFVALVQRTSTLANYLVGYTNADSINGRMGSYLYGSAVAGYRQTWASGFENIEMMQSMDLAVTPDSFVFVASNDIERNILVFRMSADSVISTDYRMVTGSDTLWAIDVDAQGRVYVTEPGVNDQPGKVKIFKSIAEDPEWLGSRNSPPLAVITVPDAGSLRGITVNATGELIYVSNFTQKKVYCYIGNPTTGYTLYNGFNFVFNDVEIIASNGVDTLRPGPWGLQLMKDKNILFVACANSFRLGVGYEYGRAYLINPNTGAYLDTIDCAAWNFQWTGSFQSRPNQIGNVSGYTSPYTVDFDDDYAAYIVSYWGWTVDKWVYQGTLPVIPLTILSVEKNESVLPVDFALNQNYPNPFNPTTTIEFTLTEDANISLTVYDINGKLVTELIDNANFSKGAYKLTFDASRLASGTYIYTLQSGLKQVSKKMTLIK